MRLDEYLVKNKYVKSRNLAKTYIVNKQVFVNGKIIDKPSFEINSDQNHELKIINEQKYVSRAGLKLEKAINEFKLELKDKVVLDVGASTGGFSDCCLQHGATKIYCVDVGHDQLDQKLLNDHRIINIEKTNIKDINKQIVPEKIDLIVSDISFISSKYLFENINKLTIDNQTQLVTLIKPQFELSPEIINRLKAKINDKKYHQLAIDKVKTFAKDNNWKVLAITESPIKGSKNNNTEFLMWCKYES